MSIEETLLPCPLCGSPAKAKTSINAVMRWVECSDGKNCRMTGPWHDTHEAAIAAWNRRAGGEREQQLEAALRDMLAGWRYIRTHHGDLYGVGWDRCEEAARAALAGQTEGERNGG